MDKMTFYFLFMNFLICNQAQACDDRVIEQLQEQHAIPSFNVQIQTQSVTSPNTFRLTKNNALVSCSENNFQVIVADTQQKGIFDKESLAELYSLAIGINNNVKGEELIKSWPTWSEKVPHAFIDTVESYLAKNYPLFKSRVINALQTSEFNRNIDTTLIDRYIAIVQFILEQKNLSNEDKYFVRAIANMLTEGSIFRNGSALSKWINYSKQAIITTLNNHPFGLEILNELSASNMQLKHEIEAYTTELDFI